VLDAEGLAERQELGSNVLLADQRTSS
jgi:hypothetical protein